MFGERQIYARAEQLTDELCVGAGVKRGWQGVRRKEDRRLWH